jgi:hypothetical protein
MTIGGDASAAPAGIVRVGRFRRRSCTLIRRTPEIAELGHPVRFGEIATEANRYRSRNCWCTSVAVRVITPLYQCECERAPRSPRKAGKTVSICLNM